MIPMSRMPTCSGMYVVDTGSMRLLSLVTWCDEWTAKKAWRPGETWVVQGDWYVHALNMPARFLSGSSFHLVSLTGRCGVLVKIKRLADNAIRTYQCDMEWYSEDGASIWQFTEGNFGCDCNRELWFEAADGNHLPVDGKLECGDGARFRVVSVNADDGALLWRGDA